MLAEDNEPANLRASVGVSGPGKFEALAVVLASIWAVWAGRQALLRRWALGDPGIGHKSDFADLVSVAGCVLIGSLAIAIGWSNRSLVAKPLLEVIGVLLLVLAVASVLAPSVAWQRFGGELRTEGERLGDGQEQQSLAFRNQSYGPDPSIAEMFFPRCRSYGSTDSFNRLVWCPSGRAPSFGGTGDRSRSIGDGWYLMY